ncbi:Glu/Leu/Phe/Val dehydrogenase dimerization domain-containing protein [Tepidibacillus sp. LV47]
MSFLKTFLITNRSSLSRGMTYKCAVSGVTHGGSKTVIC